ncbi:hypothetical protein C0Q70_21550 [Pomacea canaliculata]|uniref:Fibronectin type-III domain-containing protein n=1 Tax=Pomacea canaliculata TaxID=400727 RepID=A0A2T7NCU8_POMCA|nr:hypothetical protein C0Q70_21550 [Pomacea canaliculata]
MDGKEVSWSDSLPPASPNYMRLHMNKRDVPPDQMSFTLHSLSPGTIYFVQVRAVVEWKGRRKKGRPASTYIEVYSPPQQAPNGGQGRFSGDRETESDIESLTVSQAFFHDNILKASLTWKLKSGKRARKYLIYWKPQTCATHVQHRKRQDRPETSATSHDEQFSLYNLQPECEYAVSVQPVSHTGRKGPPVVTSFQTLPCRLIAARDDQQPRCEVLERPDKVKGLHTETVACRTVVRWTPILAGSEVVSYLVRWGQSDEAYFSSSTVIFTSDPEELQIPANETAVNLGYLEPGRHYTVQVMGQSSAGPGQPTVQHFTVPLTTAACSQEQSSTATAPVKTVTSSAETVTPTVTNSTSPEGYHNTHHMNITLRNSSISSGRTFGGFDTGDNHRQNVSSTDNSNDGVTDLAKDKNSSDAFNTTHSFGASSTPLPRTNITQGGAGGPASSSGDHLHTSLLCLVSHLVIAMTFAAKALCT